MLVWEVHKRTSIVWQEQFKLLLGLLCIFSLITVCDALAQNTEADDPTLTEPQILRFVTDDDYPPFNYRDDEGVLTGFSVDLARAICLELDVTCDVAARPWEELLQALESEATDAVIASIAATPATVSKADFSDAYYFTPARFAGYRAAPIREMTPAGLEGERIGVVARTAHAAYLKKFFRDSVFVTFRSHDAARDAIAQPRSQIPLRRRPLADLLAQRNRL